MPYSKNPQDYPSEFAQLYLQALSREFAVDFGDFGEATNYCHRLHAYRRAMELHKIPGWTDLRAITLRVKGTKIHFTNNKAIMSNIRKALGTPEPSDAELEDYLRQMETGESKDEDESKATNT